MNRLITILIIGCLFFSLSLLFRKENKVEINLVGNNFSYLDGVNKGYSVYGKESKYIRWVKNNQSKMTFYLDDNMKSAFTDDITGLKFGWLLESKEIFPNINKDIKDNYLQYFRVFKYIFTHNKELLNLDDRFKWVPANGYWIKDAKIYPKNKLISMISSNKKMVPGHLHRLEWVNKLKDSVDLYGRGFKEIKNKEEGLCDYMFSVAIENASYNSYFTEKILDCFATGTIPIYLGSPNIDKYFNPEGIIFLDENFKVCPEKVSREIYESRLNAILDNLERVKKMEVLEDWIYLNYLISLNR